MKIWIAVNDQYFIICQWSKTNNISLAKCLCMCVSLAFVHNDTNNKNGMRSIKKSQTAHSFSYWMDCESKLNSMLINIEFKTREKGTSINQSVVHTEFHIHRFYNFHNRLVTYHFRFSKCILCICMWGAFTSVEHTQTGVCFSCRWVLNWHMFIVCVTWARATTLNKWKVVCQHQIVETAQCLPDICSIFCFPTLRRGNHFKTK